MSKSLRSSRSFTGSVTSSMTTTDGDTSSKTYSFANLCRDLFRSPSTTNHFSRKDITQPLLITTPDEETEVIVKIWRNIVKFMAEAQESDVFGSLSLRSVQRSSSVLRQQSDTVSTSSGTWNTIRLKQLRTKLRQGLRRASTASLQKHECPSLDSPLETPFEQVQFIIGCALLRPVLRDEVYCMILRQLTNNPQKGGRTRGWALLGLVVGTFLPSDKVFLYVAKFIDDGPTAFSSSLKKLFVSLITDGPRHQPPSYVEYMAAVDRKPLELQVTLMDGSTHSVTVSSSVTSSEIISIIADSINLQENFGFSLFIAMENRVTSLGWEGDKVFDAISRCEQLFLENHNHLDVDGVWRLFMRKEMFSPWDDAVEDPVATNLIYAQVTRGCLLGEYVCETDSEWVALAAKQYYCEFENEISEAGLANILPTYLPPRRLGDQTKRRVWARHVVKCYRKLFDFSRDDESRPDVEAVKGKVISWAKEKWTRSFCRHFDAVQLSRQGWRISDEEEELDSTITMSIVSDGISLMTRAGKRLLQASFSQIASICGEGQDPELKSISGNVIGISLLDGNVLKLETMDANVIYRILTYCVSGLKERSIWALAIKDFNDSTSIEFCVSKGDLIKLNRPAKQEALVSLSANGTNMTTLRSGRIPTELLHIIATLKEPEDSLQLQFRSSYLCNAETFKTESESNDSKENDDTHSPDIQTKENSDPNERITQQ